MGGYGAFRLGLACPDRFAAVASLSGALDILHMRDNWADEVRKRKLEAIWGPGFECLSPESDLLALTDRLVASGQLQPRFYQWCGTADFLHQSNQRFRDHARTAGLDLLYSEGPGDHSWEHWDREIRAVLHWLLPG